jgi:hypothetical protein
MRVELIYTPGCNSYRKALNTLQTVIAEEQLPIPVEMIESTCSKVVSPTIKIDGHDIGEMPVEPQGEYCRLYRTRTGMAAVPCIELLRDLIWRKWKELTEAPLLGL